MTADTLTIVISAIGIVLTLGTSTFVGAAWMVRRIDAVAADVTDLKISVARLEGPPPPRLLLTPGRR